MPKPSSDSSLNRQLRFLRISILLYLQAQSDDDALGVERATKEYSTLQTAIADNAEFHAFRKSSEKSKASAFVQKMEAIIAAKTRPPWTSLRNVVPRRYHWDLRGGMTWDVIASVKENYRWMRATVVHARANLITRAECSRCRQGKGPFQECAILLVDGQAHQASLGQCTNCITAQNSKCDILSLPETKLFLDSANNRSKSLPSDTRPPTRSFGGDAVRVQKRVAAAGPECKPARKRRKLLESLDVLLAQYERLYEQYAPIPTHQCPSQLTELGWKQSRSSSTFDFGRKHQSGDLIVERMATFSKQSIVGNYFRRFDGAESRCMSALNYGCVRPRNKLLLGIESVWLLFDLVA